MLQQTQVDRVLPKYAEWLEKYPTLEALAAAQESDVSATWRPLGYNVRPKRLHAIARESMARVFDIQHEHADEMLAMVDEIRSQRERISRELAAMGYHPYRSGANFVLFGGVDDPHAVFEALLERGILIREIGLPGCLRVTAGTEAETTAFLEAMATFAPAHAAAAP